MNPKNTFRALVIATNLGSLAAIFLSIHLDNGQFDAAYAAMPEVNAFEAYFSNTIVLAITLIGLVSIWIGSVVGLLLFKNWGRILTVTTLIISFPCITLLGPVIEHGLESAINDLLSVCSGIILASMYFQPISAEFNKPSNSKN